jgi:hypothetical protein
MSENQSRLGSRRRFLQTTAGVGAGLASWPAMSRGCAAALAPSRQGLSLDEQEHAIRDLPEEDAYCFPNRSEVASAIEQSINYFVATGVDNHYSRPFELERIEQQPNLRKEVAAICLDYITRPAALRDMTPLFTMITPKDSMFGLRRNAHAELIGGIAYMTCAILVGKRVEPIRSPFEEKKAFSYRFKPNGVLIFDPEGTYQSFRNRALDKLDRLTRSAVVSADVANFFPSINLDRFFLTLQKCGVEAGLVAVLRNILLQWQVGLPMGLDASYLLAEAALLNVDRRLEQDRIDFLRYVDDYRLFANDQTEARQALECLIDHLAAEGLCLNSAKTAMDLVTQSEYRDQLNARRSARYWGGLRLAVDDTTKNNVPPDSKDNSQTPKEKDDSDKSKPINPPLVPPLVPPIYGDSPFKKSQLNDFDQALLRDVDPVGALSDLIMQVKDQKPVSLGRFRVFAEAACYGGQHELMIGAFGLLRHCQHCIPYFVDVFIAEQERIPEALRAAAADWFAARLTANQCTSEFELLSTATLLGTDGYRRSEEVIVYLRSNPGRISPLVMRAFLQGLRGSCNRERAEILVDLASRSEAFVRRAIFDLVWKDLDLAKRTALLETYSPEFDHDPFLRNLVGKTTLDETPRVAAS